MSFWTRNSKENLEPSATRWSFCLEFVKIKISKSLFLSISRIFLSCVTGWLCYLSTIYVLLLTELYYHSCSILNPFNLQCLQYFLWKSQMWHERRCKRVIKRYFGIKRSSDIKTWLWHLFLNSTPKRGFWRTEAHGSDATGSWSQKLLLLVRHSIKLSCTLPL